MGRRISISSLSLVVIAAALAVLAATPLVRLTVRLMVQDTRPHAKDTLIPFDPRIKQQAARRPHDAKAWLAAAVATGDPPGSGPLDIAALHRVLELKRDWPAPYLVLGNFLVAKTPRVWRQELAVSYPESAASFKRTHIEKLTEAQREDIQRAREALQKARSLDPGSAAPDYLLAYLALSEHRDREAVALLRQGLEKRQWSVGQRDANIAVYETAVRSVPPMQANLLVLAMLGPRFDVDVRLRELARIVTGMSIIARDCGDHKRAIFLRESVMHLGRVMIARAYTVTEALSGEAIWTIAACDRLTPAEQQAIVAKLGKPRRGDTAEATEARRHALTQARQAKFARYLREHGRSDLAGDVTSFGNELAAWRQTLSNSSVKSWAIHSGLFTEAGLFGTWVAATGIWLSLLVVCGLAWLVLTAVKRRPAPVRWARWKWALAIAGCLGGAQVVGMGMARLWPYGYPLGPSSLEALGVPHVELIMRALQSVLVGLPLLLVAALVVTWRVRRKSGPGTCPGFGRHYVGTLMAVLLPLTALLLATAAAWAPSANAKFDKGVKRLNVEIYEGHFALLGLPRPRPAQPARGAGATGPLQRHHHAAVHAHGHRRPALAGGRVARQPASRLRRLGREPTQRERKHILRRNPAPNRGIQPQKWGCWSAWEIPCRIAGVLI